MNSKVLNNQGSGAYSWIANGIMWAADPDNNSDTDDGAKVINLSLGGSRKLSTLESAVNYAWDQGVVIVAAAPEVNILSTFPTYDYAIGKDQRYDFGSGTSMSTPHVAGIAALVFSQGGYNNSGVREQIQNTADAIPGTGDYWIYGRVNACKAVGGVCDDQEPEPTNTPTPTPTQSEEDPTPTPTETDQDCSQCLGGNCNGKCHWKEEGTTCPDCS